MTDPNAQVPATMQDVAMPEGMEDFNPEQQVIPTLKLAHDDGKIIDGLSGQEYDEVTLICLGMIKQRVLWDAEVGEGDNVPFCRSYNFQIGHPDNKAFPWKAAGFTRPEDDDVATRLPCESCKLKEWGTHPKRGDIPWCSEQHTYAVLQDLGNGVLAPALFTAQRSALKPSNAYMTSFYRAQQPMYVCYTRISLDLRKRGSVDFVVPKFARGVDTDPAQYPNFSAQLKMIREFVQTPRGVTPTSADSDPQPPAEPSNPPAPAPAPSQPAPTQPAPVPTQTAAPEAVVPDQVTPAPAPTPAPQPVTAGASDDDDDLPF